MSGLLRAVWEFVVGDDWRLALGVAAVLALTAIVAAVGVASWWIAPSLVPLCLFASVRQALRRG